jgi:hypothetical protein
MSNLFWHVSARDMQGPRLTLPYSISAIGKNALRPGRPRYPPLLAQQFEMDGRAKVQSAGGHGLPGSTALDWTGIR